MLNDFNFMAIVTSPIHFIKKEDSSANVDIANMRLAISQDWECKRNDKSDAFFFTGICYGKLAIYANRAIQKGDLITGNGYFRNGYWKNRDGVEFAAADLVLRRLYSYQYNSQKRKQYFKEGEDKDKHMSFSDYHVPLARQSYMYDIEHYNPDTSAVPILEGRPTRLPDYSTFREVTHTDPNRIE